ncbi:Bug family tripartite tricarboxylate transporter substrate binding protein [Cryobacterium roopkundense]|uniref:Tripartite-type tricarboxylate transporter receptor subunit TctC n=1 Tax=Cryobacterium roopkundense TaxID=1001240 RepID=A0A7W8ZZA3_9MICO|nr:tripartite tricarboxylate transporter substrate binding protein [Cryobacterium roopkundense]MBB5642931.1 tripartite-type tricarboxylate transporter receptor subunit TctC [Cryobacterium roopkundense]
MHKTRRYLVIPAAALGLSAVLAGCQSGATGSPDQYPSKPVTVLMPYAAGGPSDLTARSISACLGDSLGQTFVVENKAGGSGAVAMQELASAMPDGHTLGLGTAGTLVMTPMVNSLTYSIDDFTPIGVMAENPTLIVVGEDSPYRSAEEFFAAAKKKPGTLTVGVPGATSPAAIELKRLADQYNVEVVAVPAAGNAEMTTNLLGGHVDALFINDHPDVDSRIDEGSFRALAATTPERLPWLPDLPTLAELGYTDLVDATSVFGLFGPHDLPAPVATALEGALEGCLADPAVRKQLGETLVPAEFRDGAALGGSLTEIQALYRSILEG